ncbi:unnamed protein product, partial [Oreochromis niloticus]
MKEEHNQLQLDVQRLTELISSSPVLAPQHATSRSGLCEDVTSTTPAHTSKLVPIKGQKSPHQPESAQVPFGDESQHPKDSQHGLIEELTHSLNEADLDRECSAQSPSPSVDSCPESQDFLPPMTPGERPPPLQASAARGRSPYYAGQRRVDEVYARRHRNYSQPATPPRLPRLGACYEDDPYNRQDDRYPTPGHPSCPDSHYRSPYGYGYQDLSHPYRRCGNYLDDRQQCPPDRLQPGGCSQTPLSLSRAQPIETYRGPQPTIPDFVHKDPLLHDVNTSPDATASDSISAPEESTCLVSSTSETLYVDRQTNSSQVLLKLSHVIIRSSTKMVETYAILDDGSERTILLHEAADHLGLYGEAEDLPLGTVRQDICTIHGAAVSFSISPASQPNTSFQIQRAFTAKELGLARHSYPIRALQERYRHLKHLPLPDIKEVQPLLLIGSDNPHLLTPVEPVRLGPPGGPAAVHTRLGWTLQGPSRFLHQRLTPQQCLFTSGASPEAELFSHVERLWKMDTLPYWSERLITRSRQDAEAIQRLEERTIRITVDGVNRYATPLLWKKNLPPRCATPEAVLAQLRGTEKRLAREPQKAAAYFREIQKLLQAGFVTAVAPEEAAV